MPQESSPTATTTKYQLLPESFRHETLPNTVLDESLPIPASILWQTLFGTDVLMARFYHRQQYTNLHLHAWEDHSMLGLYVMASNALDIGPHIVYRAQDGDLHQAH